MQTILTYIDDLSSLLNRYGAQKALLVCDPSFDRLAIRDAVLGLPIKLVRFSGFTPNPRYEEAVSATALFLQNGCDALIAVGGGSAMDVAKCVKLFCRMDHSRPYLGQPYPGCGVPLIAIPTTAGTGSESTRYAVIYDKGEKQSLTHADLLPNCAVLEPAAIETLPPYQRRCTMMDALCHAIESWWSMRSNEQSRALSRQAIRLIRAHQADYLQNTASGNRGMLTAANLAGQAIDITQTTAAHAMSYKLTSLYSLPHGRAVALCLPFVWEYMAQHLDACRDPRGPQALRTAFSDIAAELGAPDVDAAILSLKEWLNALELAESPAASEEEISLLKSSVNPVRLANSPIPIDAEAAEALYRKILRTRGKQP